jgi:hypothetical protein
VPVGAFWGVVGDAPAPENERVAFAPDAPSASVMTGEAGVEVASGARVLASEAVGGSGVGAGKCTDWK